jgi:hypothetical protein
MSRFIIDFGCGHLSCADCGNPIEGAALVKVEGQFGDELRTNFHLARCDASESKYPGAEQTGNPREDEPVPLD